MYPGLGQKIAVFVLADSVCALCEGEMCVCLCACVCGRSGWVTLRQMWSRNLPKRWMQSGKVPESWIWYYWQMQHPCVNQVKGITTIISAMIFMYVLNRDLNNSCVDVDWNIDHRRWSVIIPQMGPSLKKLRVAFHQTCPLKTLDSDSKFQMFSVAILIQPHWWLISFSALIF